MSEAQRKSSALLMVIHNHTPDWESLKCALRQVDVVALIDNHSDAAVIVSLREFKRTHEARCVLVENGENLGISRAYNNAVRQLQQQGVYWLHFVDHDAVFDESLFAEARALWNALEASGAHVGMVVPIVSDDPLSFKKPLGAREKYSMVRSAITSGIMTNIDIFNGLHGFDETFFVDGADIDLTLRLIRSGYSIFRINRVLIFQGFGSNVEEQGTMLHILAKFTAMTSRVMLALGFVNAVQTTRHHYPTDRQDVQSETSERINVSQGRLFLRVYQGAAHRFVEAIVRFVR